MGRQVFTDSGDLFGEVEGINLVENKIDSWRIVISKESSMSSWLNGARGIIVPHQLIKAIGDVVLINKNAIPVREEEEEFPLDDEEDLI